MTIARAAGVIDTAVTGPAARPPSSSSATSPIAGRTRSRSSAACSSSRRKRRARAGRSIVVLGNHEAMNLLGDYRYTTPGELRRFADDQSAARRERSTSEPRADRSLRPHAPIRRLTAEAIRRRGSPSTRSAGSSTSSPGGRRANWGNGRPAIRPSSRSGTPCSFTAGSAPNMRRSRSTRSTGASRRRWRRATKPHVGPDRSARTAVVSRPGRRRCRSGGGARRDRCRQRRRSTADQELDAVLAAYGAKRLVIAHTPTFKGIADHERRPPGSHRYRHLALLRRAADLAGDRRRPADSAHGGEAAVTMEGADEACVCRLGAGARRAGGVRSRRRRRSRCSPATTRSTHDPGAAFDARFATATRDAASRHADGSDGDSLADHADAARNHPARRPRSATSRRCASTSPRRRRRARCSPARSKLKLVTHCRDSAAFPAICAARIFRVPDVQPADSAELPRAARQHRLSRRRAAGPIISRVGFFSRISTTSPSATA